MYIYIYCVTMCLYLSIHPSKSNVYIYLMSVLHVEVDGLTPSILSEVG